MRKRGVSLLLATLMVWTLTVPAWGAVNPFSDVESDHWAYEAIIKLAAAGLVEGYPDGTFGGDRTFTRYEMAMVFARILARFENLIDQRIDEGIDARTGDLAQQIKETRDELARFIQDNEAGLAVAGSLGDVIQEETAGAGIDKDTMRLSDQARAVLADLVAEELSERLDDLGRRVLRLEGSTPSRTEAELIAEKMIAEALADSDSELGAAYRAAQGDTGSLSDLIDSKVSVLGSRIDRLTDEFRPELERLGVKVAELESRIDDHDSDIAYLKARSDDVKITGKNETVFEQISTEGDGPFYKDPRNRDYDDDDEDEFLPDEDDVFTAGNEFYNKFTLTVTALPADNVEVSAELGIENNLLLSDLDDNVLSMNANLDVTTPGVMRSLHVGDLDRDVVSDLFDKYTLHAETFDDEDDDEDDKQGANVNLVLGQGDSTQLQGFVSRLADADHAFGAAMSYTLSPAFDLTFRGVRQVTSGSAANTPPVPAASNTVVGVESTGELGPLEYSAKFAQNESLAGGVEQSGTAIEAWAEAPISIVSARLDYGSVDAEFDPIFGKELDDDPDNKYDDWLDKYLNPDEDADWLTAGQSEYKTTLSAPLLGAEAQVAFGQRDETQATPVGDENTYAQASLSGIDFAGVSTGLLYDRRTNQDDEVDNTARANFQTTLAGVALDATIHNRTNDQVAAPEEDQRGTWIAAERDLHLLLPFTVDGRYGINQSLDETYTRLGVSSEYNLGLVRLSAGYSTEQNAIGDLGSDDVENLDDIDNVWWKNTQWQLSDAKRDVATVGVGYTLKNFLGAEVDTGYEYRVVRSDDAVAGTVRNTYQASFEKELRGEVVLAGEAKLVTGGTEVASGVAHEDGNERDLTAKLTLTYPVFSGADLMLGGEYVSSSGSRTEAGGATNTNEYEVYNLNAGLTVAF